MYSVLNKLSEYIYFYISKNIRRLQCVPKDTHNLQGSSCQNYLFRYLLRLLEKQNALHSAVFFIFFFFPASFAEYRGIRGKIIFTCHQTVNAIPLFVAIKEIFLVYSFSG